MMRNAFYSLVFFFMFSFSVIDTIRFSNLFNNKMRIITVSLLKYNSQIRKYVCTIIEKRIYNSQFKHDNLLSINNDRLLLLLSC